MKKHLLLTIVACLSMPCFAQHNTPDQWLKIEPNTMNVRTGEDDIPDANWTPLSFTDVVVTDMKDTKYNIDQILNSGKFIFLDISATWCPPCWEYHKLGELEKLYEAHGKGDNRDIYVFWAEGDANGKDDLNIIGEGESTNGDWTNKGTVPYPMFINHNGQKLVDILDMKNLRFPVFLLISPMRRYTTIQAIRNAKDQWHHIQQYITQEREAMKTEAPKIFRIMAPTLRYSGEPIPVSVRYTSFEKPKFTYEVEGRTTEVESNNFTIPSLKPGKHTVKVTATTKQGMASRSFEIEISEKECVSMPISYDFNDSKLPKDWITLEKPYGGKGWTPVMSFMHKSVQNFTEKHPNLNFALDKDALVSFSFVPKSTNGKSFSGKQLTNIDDYLVTSLIEVPNDAKRPGLTLFFGGIFKNPVLDYLEVLVSPTGKREPEHFTESVAKFVVNDPSVDARYRYGSISLEKYKGKTIAIAFRHYIDPMREAAPSAGTLLDNVKFIKDDYLAIEVPELNNTLLYPTKTATTTTINAPRGSHIAVFNLNGEQVDAFEMPNDSHVINVAGYAKGTYFVRVNAKNGNFRVLTLVVE